MFVGDGLDCLEDFGPDSQHRNQQLGTPRLMRRLIGHLAQKKSKWALHLLGGVEPNPDY